MAELLKTKEGELTTADLASYGIPPKQPDGPKLVKGQEPETLDTAAAVSEPMPLFSELEMEDFRSQWSTIQTGFVDEPRRTVEDADKLVGAVMQRLAEGFAHERSGLEKQWDRGDNVSTRLFFPCSGRSVCRHHDCRLCVVPRALQRQRCIPNGQLQCAGVYRRKHRP